MNNLSINEHLIDKNLFKFKNMDNIKMTMQESGMWVWHSFGYECILNCKKEAIIIIIGGSSGGYNLFCQKIHWYNCVTNEFICHNKVEFKFKIVPLFL